MGDELNREVTIHTLIFNKIVKKEFLTLKFKQDKCTEIIHNKKSQFNMHGWHFGDRRNLAKVLQD